MQTELVPRAPATSSPLLLVEVQGSHDYCRIVVSGELERSSSTQLSDAVIHVLRHERPAHIDMDFAGVVFLDIGGVRALLACWTDAQQVGCRITLSNVQPHVYRVLELTGARERVGMRGQ